MGKESKKQYSIRLYPDFKNELDVACEVEGVRFNELVERELRRYLRALKRATNEYARKKEIEKRIKQEKNEQSGN